MGRGISQATSNRREITANFCKLSLKSGERSGNLHNVSKLSRLTKHAHGKWETSYSFCVQLPQMGWHVVQEQQYFYSKIVNNKKDKVSLTVFNNPGNQMDLIGRDCNNL